MITKQLIYAFLFVLVCAEEECNKEQVYSCGKHFKELLKSGDRIKDREEFCNEAKTATDCLLSKPKMCDSGIVRLYTNATLEILHNFMDANCNGNEKNTEEDAAFQQCKKENLDYITECKSLHSGRRKRDTNWILCRYYKLTVKCMTERMAEKCGEEAGKKLGKRMESSMPIAIKSTCVSGNKDDEDGILPDVNKLLRCEGDGSFRNHCRDVIFRDYQIVEKEIKMESDGRKCVAYVIGVKCYMKYYTENCDKEIVDNYRRRFETNMPENMKDACDSWLEEDPDNAKFLSEIESRGDIGV